MERRVEDQRENLGMVLCWDEGQKEATKVENKQHSRKQTKIKTQTREGEFQEILNGGWFYQ